MASFSNRRERSVDAIKLMQYLFIISPNSFVAAFMFVQFSPCVLTQSILLGEKSFLSVLRIICLPIFNLLAMYWREEKNLLPFCFTLLKLFFYCSGSFMQAAALILQGIKPKLVVSSIEYLEWFLLKKILVIFKKMPFTSSQFLFKFLCSAVFYSELKIEQFQFINS